MGVCSSCSGEVQIRFASIQVCEDGLIVWMKNYNEIDETRAAAERVAEERAEADV